MMSKLIFPFVFLVSFSLFAQPDTLVLRPGPTDGKDAMIGSCVPCQHTNRNFGDRTIMDVNTWTFSGNFSQMRGLLAFDFSQIPPNATILEAKLSLYYTGLPQNQNGPHSPLNPNNAVVIRRITSPWNEMTVTWNNQPAVTAVGEVAIPHPTSGTQNFLNLDVTDFVDFQYINPGQNHGFMLIQTNNSTFHQITVASSDHPNPILRPQLEIIFETPCPTRPVADFTFAIGANRQVSFINTSTSTPGVSQYRWTFGDGSLSIAQNPIYTYNADGRFRVCLAVTDTCGTDTICQFVNICGPGPLNFNTTRSGPLTYQFTSNWPNATSYLWDFGDGNLSTLRNPTYTYSAQGNYTVCLTAEDSVCGVQTICLPIDPCAQNPLMFTPTQTNPLTVRLVPSRLQANSYLWDLGDGRSSIVQQPTVSYGAEGNYRVCVTVDDSCGIETFCDTIFVSQTVGLDAWAVQNIAVYPNPAKDLLHISIPEQVGYSVQIINAMGQVVLHLPHHKHHKLNLNVSNWSRGVYMAVFEVEGQHFTKRLLLN
jgi:PKD repeat protein